MARERQVRIVNPPPHGAQFTSPKRAIKYLKEGRARVAGEFAIEFLPENRCHLAVLASIARRYDTEGPARPHNSPTIDEVRESQPIADSGFQGFGRYPMFPEDAFRPRPRRRATVIEFPSLLPKAA